jgi:hypothetical protein
MNQIKIMRFISAKYEDEKSITQTRIGEYGIHNQLFKVPFRRLLQYAQYLFWAPVPILTVLGTGVPLFYPCCAKY